MRTRRLPLILSVVTALVVVSLLPHAASAETDAERERDRVRREQADVAANVDALNADKAEVEAALAQLHDQVRSEEEALASAQREVAEAEAAQDRAEAGIERAEAEVTALEDRLRAQMIEQYTTADGGDLSILDAESATDIVKRRAILNGRAADDEDLVDQVRAAQADLRAQRHEAQQAEERAEAKRREVEERLASVEAARDQQAAFSAQVQERIDDQTAYAVQLAEDDRELSAQIAREQAELQARLLWAQQVQQQREAEAAAAAQAQAQAQAQAAQAAQQQAAQPANDYDDSGREPSGPVATPGGGGVTSAGGNYCNASGITVACSIAGNVSAMISAAAADGVSLTGSGYRDPSRQIALREQHCGSSYYAIYEMPSSQCRPPTARPGSSQHEVGLAIDFNNCSSRGTACFRWLAGNAARFGMHNLPAEPWHWSVNGN